MAMARRLAVVLRGPPGTGKTTLSRGLQDHFGLLRDSHVVLDRYWIPREKRFDGPDRYWDLRNQPDILLIELGFGEPFREPFAGATKNPSGWVSILDSDRREICLFCLTVDKRECLRRVAARGDMSAAAASAAWDRYAPGQVCSSQAFTSRLSPPRTEHTVNTQALDPTSTVRLLVDKIG
jgi:hypothetical protein